MEMQSDGKYVVHAGVKQSRAVYLTISKIHEIS